MKNAFLKAVAVVEGTVGTQPAAGPPKVDTRGWVKKYQKLYTLLLKSTDRKCILNDMAKELYHLEQQMKEAIRRSGMSCYQISKTTGVSEAQLSLFMNGKRSLTLKSASKIAEALKLELNPRGRKRGKNA